MFFCYLQKINYLQIKLLCYNNFNKFFINNIILVNKFCVCNCVLFFDKVEKLFHLIILFAFYYFIIIFLPCQRFLPILIQIFSQYFFQNYKIKFSFYIFYFYYNFIIKTYCNFKDIQNLLGKLSILLFKT